MQVAAGALDASAKIYAARVDSVHADAFRVLGCLGKDPARAKEPESPEEGGNSLFSSPKSREFPLFLPKNPGKSPRFPPQRSLGAVLELGVSGEVWDSLDFPRDPRLVLLECWSREGWEEELGLLFSDFRFQFGAKLGQFRAKQGQFGAEQGQFLTKENQ